MKDELMARKAELQDEMKQVDGDLASIDEQEQQQKQIKALLQGVIQMQQETAKLLVSPRVSEVVRDPKTNRITHAISRIQGS